MNQLCAVCMKRPATVPDRIDGRTFLVCRPCRDDEVTPAPTPTMPERVVRMVRLSPGATVEDLAMLLDDSERGHQRISTALHRASIAGMLIAVGAGKERYYHPAPKGYKTRRTNR